MRGSCGTVDLVLVLGREGWGLGSRSLAGRGCSSLVESYSWAPRSAPRSPLEGMHQPIEACTSAHIWALYIEGMHQPIEGMHQPIEGMHQPTGVGNSQEP